MTAIDFPDSPTAGDTFVNGDVTYTWDGVKWTAKGSEIPHVKKAGDTMTGNLTVPSINNGPLAGFRNLIINPCAQINQRGDQAGWTGQRYSMDRWRWSTNGASTINTYALSPIALGAASDGLIDLIGTDYRARMTRASGTDTISFDQPVEGINVLVPGKQYTISVYVNSTSNLSLGLSGRYHYGTGSSTAEVSFSATPATVSYTGGSGWQRLSATFTAPSHAATVDIKGDASTTIYVAGITANAEFSGWQVEPGPVATPFEHRPIGTELALCQRYFQKRILEYRNDDATPGPSSHDIQDTFPVVMRATPTVSKLGSVGTVNFTSPGYNPKDNQRGTFVGNKGVSAPSPSILSVQVELSAEL